MLSVKNIYKSYGTLKVLQGINLEIKKSEVVTIIGSSGAGKSTLLHILGTLSTPDQGTVFFNGSDIFTKTVTEMAKFRNKNIGFVFQFHNLLSEFSAIENIMMPGLIAGDAKEKVQKRAYTLMEKLALSHRQNHKPSQMSGGERQRTAVARSLINSPSLIFADEPSGNLDSKNAKELHNLFFSLREDFGSTFVIVTHNQEFADMADRKIEMQDGLIVTPC